MLIAPGYVPEGGGIDWCMVTASGILGLGPEGQVLEGDGLPELSGACIHLGVRRSKPGARVSRILNYYPTITTITTNTNTTTITTTTTIPRW